MTLKQYIVDYVGNLKSLEDGAEITSEMVIETLMDEFPEVMFTLYQEVFLKGYETALSDLESVHGDLEKNENS